jgi:hypothetical protein
MEDIPRGEFVLDYRGEVGCLSASLHAETPG